MTTTQSMPGKKVKLEVYAEDAPGLREKGSDFFAALQGATISPQDQVLFGSYLIDVKATKPKGAIQVVKDTAVQVTISKKPVRLTCASCGREQDGLSDTCSQCGSQLNLVSL